PTKTAVIADLHLDYDQVRRRSGEAVPHFSLSETLYALATLVERHEIRQLAIAGDVFEDGRCAPALEKLIEGLHAMDLELVGIAPGNPDRPLDISFMSLPFFPKGFMVGRWRVVHGDGSLPRGKIIQGHIHPSLRWPGKPAAPCFLFDKRRLVLPAFSADAAGVNVLTLRKWDAY